MIQWYQQRLTQFYPYRRRGTPEQIRFNQAKRRLQLLLFYVQFDDLEEPDYDGNWQEEVCRVCESTESLSSCVFEDNEGHEGYPLLHLVLGLGSLAQIKRVYDLYPSAVIQSYCDENGRNRYLLHEAGSNCSEVICFLIDACPSAIHHPDVNVEWAFHYAWMNSDYEHNNGRDWFTCKKLLGIGTENPVRLCTMFVVRTIQAQSRLYDLEFLIRIVVSMPYGPERCYPPMKDAVLSKQSFWYLLMIMTEAGDVLEDHDCEDEEINHLLGLIYSLCHSTDIWFV